MRNLLTGLAVILSGCARPASPPVVPLENDLSIEFPRFFESSPVELGAQGVAYELDGVLLRALTIAVNHRFQHVARDQPCLRRPEAHQYRIIRRGGIIFIRIDQDLEFCGLAHVISLDSGVTYAISADGRILRRVFDGEPVRWEPSAPVQAAEPEPWDGGMGGDGVVPLSVPTSAPDAGSPVEPESPR